MNERKEKGFTLVELSIVLVIIGLLIGGIIAGRSMIETAKLHSFIQQIGQFNAAVANFSTKYNSFPGDSGLFVAAGNNNGIIESSIGGGAWFWAGESSFFWKHLSDTGFTIDGAIFSETLTGGVITPKVNVPVSIIGTGGIAIVQGRTGVVPNGNNYYYVGNYADNRIRGAGSGTTAALTGQQALAIDTKLDDGVTSTGNTGGDLVSCDYFSTTSTPVCNVSILFAINGTITP